jgi:hypothetical protein
MFGNVEPLPGSARRWNEKKCLSNGKKKSCSALVTRGFMRQPVFMNCFRQWKSEMEGSLLLIFLADKQ